MHKLLHTCILGYACSMQCGGFGANKVEGRLQEYTHAYTHLHSHVHAYFISTYGYRHIHTCTTHVHTHAYHATYAGIGMKTWPNKQNNKKSRDSNTKKPTVGPTDMTLGL
jgi:hypothetical protein